MSIKSVANVGRSILPIVVGSYAGNYAKGLFGGSEFAGGVGWFLGQAGLNAILPKQKVQQQGSRLSDLSVQSSSYGTTIPLIFGRVKVAGTFIWARPLEEYTKVSTTSDGKGGSGVKTETTEYKYRANFAIYLGEGPNEMVHRIWANGTLIFEDGKYMPTNTTTALNLNGTMPDEGVDIAPNIRMYFGTETQLPDPIIESYEGIGEVPAHRGLTYLRFTDFELEPYGNSMPVFEFELSNYVAAEEPETYTAELPVKNGVEPVPPEAHWLSDYDDTTGMLAMRVRGSLYSGPTIERILGGQPLYVQRYTGSELLIDMLPLPAAPPSLRATQCIAAVGGCAYLAFISSSVEVSPPYIKVALSADGSHRVVSLRLPGVEPVGPLLTFENEGLPEVLREQQRLNGPNPHASFISPGATVAGPRVVDSRLVLGEKTEHQFRPVTTVFSGTWPNNSYHEAQGPLLTDQSGGYWFLGLRQLRPVAWSADGAPRGGWVACEMGYKPVALDELGLEIRSYWRGVMTRFDESGALVSSVAFSEPTISIHSSDWFIDPSRGLLVSRGVAIQFWEL